jgi:hypothetical protein
MKLKQNKQLNHKHIKIKKKNKKKHNFFRQKQIKHQEHKEYDEYLNRNLTNTNLKPNKFSCNQGQSLCL